MNDRVNSVEDWYKIDIGKWCCLMADPTTYLMRVPSGWVLRARGVLSSDRGESLTFIPYVPLEGEKND